MKLARVIPALLCLLPLLSLESARAVTYQNGMPEEQKRMMEEDFDFLTRLDFSATADPQTQKIFNLDSRLTSESLRAWLDERVKIIVPQNWNPDAAITLTGPAVYPNADLFPVSDKPGKTGSNGKGPVKKGTVTVVMTNTGAGIYMRGKVSKLGLNLELNGNILPVYSPRLGLIQVGQGYFYSYYFGKNAGKPSSDSTRIARLAVLFHEARHIDGNGVSVAFFHAVCPDSVKEYAGYPACDRSLNGSYTIGALASKALTSACKSCSVVEKDKLRARTLDSFARVLSETQEVIDRKALDAATQEMTDCYTTGSFGMPTPACAAILERIKAASATHLVPTKEMDPNPEARKP